MSNIVEISSFTLKKGVAEKEYLHAEDTFQTEFLSKQKGFISRNILFDGTKYYDIVTWETLDALKDAIKNASEHEATSNYLSYVDPIGTYESGIPICSVVKTY